LNETLLWLAYFASGGASFAAAYYCRWRVWLAIVIGGLVTLIGWLLLFRFTDEDKRPDWIRLDLSLNLCFGLLFAALGAGLAWWLLSRRGKAD
jgi:cytochrome c biogenesis protein CcdA